MPNSPQDFYIKAAGLLRQEMVTLLPGFSHLSMDEKEKFVATFRDVLFFEQNALSFDAEVEKQNRTPPPWQSED